MEKDNLQIFKNWIQQKLKITEEDNFISAGDEKLDLYENIQFSSEHDDKELIYELKHIWFLFKSNSYDEYVCKCNSINEQPINIDEAKIILKELHQKQEDKTTPEKEVSEQQIGGQEKIYGYKYENGTLFYYLGIIPEKSKWVRSIEVENEQMIRNYWRSDLNKTIFNSQMSLPPPTKLIEMKEFNGIKHVLCRFPNFDVPVYVPVTILRNSCGAMLIAFYESVLSEQVKQKENE